MKSVRWGSGTCKTDCDGLLIFNLLLDRFTCIAIREVGSFYRIHPEQATNTSKTYLNDMRENRLKVTDKVLNGNYPFWLKYAVGIIRREL